MVTFPDTSWQSPCSRRKEIHVPSCLGELHGLERDRTEGSQH